ncbi:MAG: DNA topoisomerase (ATP-hydrolyzing) subunit B [Actinomycetales bacterium]|nr:DNA topoisomerase (ATP-hydrolyzing) subunit B [Actinomycetales bacterium]
MSEPRVWDPSTAPPNPAGLAGGAAVYDASTIQVLEGLAAVRKRPGMYIGSTGERGLHHLVYEVVDNAVDEALAGFATRIDVELRDDGWVEVTDDGRGIPVDQHPLEGVSALEVVMTTLHAGGKFGSGGYTVSGGLHGVGVSVVNALSTDVEVTVWRDGFVWQQGYRTGVPTAPISQGEPTTRTGTRVRFRADPTIFDATDYSFSTLATRFREMAFLNRGLTIGLVDARVAQQEANTTFDATPDHVEFCYAGGITDFVSYLNAAKGEPILNRDIIEINAIDEQRGMSLDIALQWNAGYTEAVHTFANTINTHEGGMHEEGFRAALTATINRYARTWAVLKEKDPNLGGEDVREGLTAIVSIKLMEPQFEGQTKTKLGNNEAKTFTLTATNDGLASWFDGHPQEGKEIARKAMSAATARIAARKARDLARSRKGLLGSSGLPGKLSDCQSNEPDECELFIVEGDSAGGSAKQGRDPRTQAILPIRGKILNVEKARIDKVLHNSEVQALFSALGTGVQDDVDVNRLRYGKVVLMADADVDGQHIRTLLLTLLFRYMRPLVELGHVFLAQPPLYKIKWSREEPEFAYSDRERDALVELGQAHGRRLPKGEGIQRYKGLGEMNADELWETTMDPATRVLLQITLNDAAAADEMFSVLMGEDVESRRTFIQRNARDVRFLDI